MQRILLLATIVFAISAGHVFAQKEEAKIFSGDWIIESAQRRGEEFKPPVGSTIGFNDGKMTITKANGDKEGDGTFTLNAEADPKEINMKPDDAPDEIKLSGIYKVEDKKLIICMSDGERPKEFATDDSSGQVLLITLKRKE